ncbi:hypothetical protein AHAS_Ahas11G0133500 [Arachis hypogaea]
MFHVQFPFLKRTRLWRRGADADGYAVNFVETEQIMQLNGYTASVVQNLKMKKLRDEKKCALATQYAAEATLRRVHANQKDDDSLPIDSIIAPFEAEIKIYKNEEENKIREKTHCQKILEVEKLSQTIQEETILASGATTNAIRDYQRRISELLVGIS